MQSLKLIKQLKSKMDRSVNWVLHTPQGHILETRFVQRKSDKIISYLSSSSGCPQKCTFCYLTQNGESKTLHHVTPDEYVEQAKYSLEYFCNDLFGQSGLTKRVNFNFMSRGSPLATKHVINDYPTIYTKLHNLAEQYHLNSKINISTIMPHNIMNRRLMDIFQLYPVNLYYSLWSVNDAWRKKNMPGAMDYRLALKKLLEYQQQCKHFCDNNKYKLSDIFTLTIHGGFIKDENDQEQNIEKMAHVLQNSGLENVKFNLVRFNPHQNLKWEESNQLAKIFNTINNALGNHNRSYLVPRVGPDVYASCGMFVNGHTFMEDPDL